MVSRECRRMSDGLSNNCRKKTIDGAARNRSEAVVRLPAALQANDPVAKLKQLKEMLDGGLISAEEFNVAKAKILGGT